MARTTMTHKEHGADPAQPAETEKNPAEPLLSQFGCGHHLLEGVDIEALLATPIDDMFADYMPEEEQERLVIIEC